MASNNKENNGITVSFSSDNLNWTPLLGEGITWGNGSSKIYYGKEKSLEEQLGVKEILISDPATIVFFKDGTKEIIKLSKNEKPDVEKAILWCIVKRIFGNSTRVRKLIKSAKVVEKRKKKDKSNSIKSIVSDEEIPF